MGQKHAFWIWPPIEAKYKFLRFLQLLYTSVKIRVRQIGRTVEWNRRGVLDTTLCDKICQWLAAGWWFSPEYFGFLRQ